MSDDFFEELQGEFLIESAFLLDQYEEAMLQLEAGQAAEETMSLIFRVAHSIKGGAAAVGFIDLNKFAHIAEDLLALLRVYPHILNPEIVSLLLKAGDALKSRVEFLKTGQRTEWDIAELQQTLKTKLNELNEYLGLEVKIESKAEVVAESNSTANTESSTTVNIEKNFEENINTDAAEPTVHKSYEEFIETLETNPHSLGLSSPNLNDSLALPLPQSKNDEALDLTNYELLAELQAQLGGNPLPNNASSESPSPTPPLKVIQPQAQTSGPVSQAATAPVNAPTTAKSQSSTQAATANTSIKIDVGRIDSVLDTVGEIVVLKNQLLHDETIKSSGSPRLASIVDQIDKLVRDLYDRSLAMRLTPLKSMFVKIQRIVRDVSIQVGKDVELVVQGEETEVERTVFELLGDPMVHLVRNALDHGIETPAQRAEKGKSPKAILKVTAQQQGGNVIIDIQDDGAGINRDRILSKAIEKNLIPIDRLPESYTDEEVFQMIFLPGFSTAEKVTDLSGRGVGLDVVKSNLEKARGKIDIFSKPNQGSTFRLTIPLSTAITDGIIVTIGNGKYILPIYSIREIVRLNKVDVTNLADKGTVVRVRDQMIPVIDVSKIFYDAEPLFVKDEFQLMLILDSVHGLAALPVSQINGQAQVVVKPAQFGATIAEVSGAAILGDGKTVLIIDPQSLILNGIENQRGHSKQNSQQPQAA